MSERPEERERRQRPEPSQPPEGPQPQPSQLSQPSSEGPEGPEPRDVPEGRTGPELARAALDAARAHRRPARRRSPPADPDADPDLRPARGRRWSGPGPDPRDPQPFGAVLGKLIRARGWEGPAAEARLFGMWEQVVGPELAGHCRPVALNEGELTVEASSTAWATQLRLLAGSLLKKIAAEVGHNVVTRLRIHGPAAPSWHRGPRRVRGRGPRDTYG